MFRRLHLLLAFFCLFLNYSLFSQQEWIPVGPDDFVPVVDQRTIVTAMAVSSAGVPYVAHLEDNEGNRITVRRNLNNNWEIVGQALISDGNAGELQLAFDVNDILYLAYADGSRGGKLTVQRFIDGIWEVLGQPGFTPGIAAFVDLKIKSDGTPVVAYSDDQNAERTSVQEFVNGNWEYIGVPGVSSGAAEMNSMAINNLDEVHVIYKDENSGNKATVKKFSNGNWILLGPAGLSTGVVFDPFITIAPNGEPHIAYSDTSIGSKILVQKFSNNTWTSVGTGLPNNPCGNPQIVFIPSTGEAYMTYNNYAFQGRHEVRRLTGSNFWSNTGNTQISKGDAQFLELQVTADNKLFIKYTDAGFDFRTVVQRYNGTLWEVFGAPGIDNGQVDFTSMSVSPQGVPYIAYRDSDQNNKLTVKRQAGRTWETVGSPGISLGEVASISALFSNDGAFYVAYSDFSLGSKLTVKKHDGTQWSDVGVAGISTGIAGDITLKQSESGKLYVGYRDQVNSNKATIQVFDNNVWQVVGTAASNQGSVNNLSFAISPNDVPYIAYMDTSIQQKLTVERFENGSWEYVGAKGFSEGLSGFNDLEFSPSGEAYIAYYETTFSPNSNGITVRKLNNNSWDPVGPARFSSSISNSMSLGFDQSGTPLIAYEDGANGSRVTLSSFTNGEWIASGDRGITGGKSSHISLDFGPNGVPFIGYTIGDAYVKRYDSRTPPVFENPMDIEVNEDFEGIALDLESSDADPEGDQEGAGLVYSFSTDSSGGADNSLFDLNSITGQLSFKEIPNFETPIDAGNNNVYNLQVRVTDLDGLSSTQDISITVKNIELRYVTPTGAGTKDGSSWANALDDLQTAFDRSAANETVWIASGTYYPTTNPFATGDPRDNALFVDVPLTIYGGFNGTETSLDQRDLQSNITVLSGDINGDDSGSGFGESLQLSGNEENTFHVLVLHNISGTTTIDGIHFRGGNANGTGNPILNDLFYNRDNAGGLLANNCQSLLLSNLVFESHFGGSGGGAIGVESITSLVMDHITVQRNIGTAGGGMFANSSSIELSHSKFLENRALNSGGAIWSSNSLNYSIDKCIFEGNVSTVFGGALGNSSSSPVITNSKFQFNKSDQGGAIFNRKSNGGFSADRIFILDNEAVDGGAIAAQGGLFTLQNSVVSGNLATERGGAIWLNQGGIAIVTNSTIVKNKALIEGGAIYSLFTSLIELINTVFYQNFDPSAPITSFSITGGILSNLYNAADDGLKENAAELKELTSSPFINIDDPDGADNIWGTEDDGLFPGDLYSPLIDNAKLITFETALDITGADRILNNGVDIGAYEFKGPYNQQPVITPPGTVTVEENSSAIIVDLESTDPEGEVDGNALMYEFSNLDGGGHDNYLFQLSPQTGEISFIEPADFEQPKDFGEDNQYSLQVSVFDRGGLTDHLDFEITVINVEDANPTIECESTIFAPTEPDSCTALLAIQEPQIADDFSLVENLILSVARSDDANLGLTDPFPLGQTTLVWTVQDESGKESSCIQEIEIFDSQPPELICQSISIELDENGIAELDPLELYGNSTDNCSIEEVEFSRSLMFSVDDIGDNEVFITLNDTNPNNTQVCSVIVTVISNDSDGDGVLNADDLCPDTPAETQVDQDGCPIFSLPADNFLIRTQGSSCPGTQNALIEVTAVESRNYTLRLLLDGNEIVMTEFEESSWTSSDLGPGQYTLCLGVPEEPDYELCFSLVLTEPEPLSVSSKVHSGTSRTVELNLTGANSYIIRHNDTQFTTLKNKLEIELVEGKNLIEVRTEKECQGTFQKQFFWINQLRASPNPTNDILVVNTSLENAQLPIRIFDTSGRLITSSIRESNALGEVELNLSTLEAALYIIKIGESEVRVIKE